MDILNLENERVDDLPVLMKQLERMRVAETLDRAFPTHGNWQGPSLGSIVVIWLTHVLSQANHRLNHVQPWVESRQETLSALAGYRIRPLDFADDRLAGVLRYLNDDMAWREFERSLNRSLLRVYDLDPGRSVSGSGSDGVPRVRVDSTTAAHHGPVTEEGLFQYGHSKDRRPDLGQVKLMMATLDPLGLPLATHVVSGEHADDPLYLPVIQRVQRSFGREGLLFIGDCKMAALATRAYLYRSGDAYLCPLSEKQWTKEQQRRDLEGVFDGSVALTFVERTSSDGASRRIAEGFEIEEVVTATLQDEHFSDRRWTGSWTERRLIVRSRVHAASEETALRERLKRAQIEISALSERKQGKRRIPQPDDLLNAARLIVLRHRVADLVSITLTTDKIERPRRSYGDRPADVVSETLGTITVEVDPQTLETAIQHLGWRAYASIEPKERLTLEGAVLAYREEYLIERGFGRLKGRPLSLTPMYLARDDHATGLIRLLSIALRVLTLLEFVVRRSLARDYAELAGLYAGQPTRKTPRPTAEMLLKAFEGVTLTCIHHADGTFSHVTPLSELHQRILAGLDFPQDLFSALAGDRSADPKPSGSPPSPHPDPNFPLSQHQMAEP